jgi:hypothetical protein
MLDDLNRFFVLASNFRTSNIIAQTVILEDAMPALAERTSSPRLKGAISNFIQENARADRPFENRGF